MGSVDQVEGEKSINEYRIVVGGQWKKAVASFQ